MNTEQGMLNIEWRYIGSFIQRSTFLVRYSIFPLLCAICALCGHSSVQAEESLAVDARDIDHFVATSIGVTAKGTPIPAWVYEDEYGLATKKMRILLVGDGTIAARNAIGRSVPDFYRNANEDLRERYIISAVANPYPDGPRGNTFNFPPQGKAYAGDDDPEAAYLWRWIGMHAPDLVVTVAMGKSYDIGVPPSELPQLAALAKEHRGTVFRDDDLAAQLVKAKPADVGSIPAVSLAVPSEGLIHDELLAALDKAKFTGPSPARKEMQRRLDRTPLEVARQLGKVYGKDLGSAAYIPAVAAMGQVRLAKLTDDAERHASVKQLAKPYISGDKPSNPTRDVAYAGHLIFAELADASAGNERERYIALVRRAADALLNDDGTPNLKKMSNSQMSDAVFMSGPILARAGRLTGEAKYFDAAAAHAKNMAKLVLRSDGLYRHSPLDEAAWGRGNGFPAVGLAMILSDLPQDHPQRDALLQLYQRHMGALAKHQDYTGAWHQVIDREESYRELSCTCIITFAMVRGVQRGWLDRDKFQPVIKSAWQAIRTRVAEDGTLVDVCTGTGKQKTLHAYFDRTAILGRDPRGGAMALLVAAELANGRDF